MTDDMQRISHEIYISDEAELDMLRDAIHATNNVIIVTDPNLPDNPIIYINREFERLTGYGRDEIIGRNCRFLQGDDREQEAVHTLRNAVARAERAHVELRNYRKDGSLFWNELYITPIFKDGHLKYFFGVQNDITARKRAEEQHRLLFHAVENADESIVVTDNDLDEPGPRFIYANPAFSRITGYDREEILGGTPRVLQGRRTDPKVLARLRQRLQAGKNFKGETFNYRKDGTPFVMNWHIAPIREANGDISHFVATQRDVTERRRLEREILDISSREQQRIAGDLHDRLQQQLIGLQMLNKRALGRLEGLAGDAAARSRADLEQIQTELKNALEDVRDIVRGILPVRLTRDGLMLALEHLVESSARVNGLACSFEYEELVLFDDHEQATHVYSIALEAINNAVKHARASRIDVRLSCADGMHVLTVSDDGVGIAPTEDGEGVGIALMRYRASVIGGQLDVVSSEEGTTVACSFYHDSPVLSERPE